MAYKVLDVSRYNKIKSYETAAKDVDGVIIRCGYRGSTNGKLTEDSMFMKHAVGFSNAGAKIGVYFFTTAINVTEAAEEAVFTVSLIKKYNLNISFPVFVDTEMSNKNHTGRADKLNKSVRTECIVAYCEKMQTLGYTAGVYASDSWFVSQLNLSSVTIYKLWVAKYSTAAPKYVSNYTGWQYTSNGSVAGIPKRVDLSHWYESISTNNNSKPPINISGNPYVEPRTIIKLNSKGEGVLWLQYELSKLGYKLNIDGDFGPKTNAALKDYQKSRGLEADGELGSITRNALKNKKPKISNTIKLESGAGPIKLDGVCLYSNSKTNVSIRQLIGDYYIWNDKIVNDKIRICKDKDSANKLTGVVGWVKYSDVASYFD